MPGGEAFLGPLRRRGERVFCLSLRICILGPGCRKCNELYARTVRVVESLDGLDAEVVHITDLDEITSYGPLLTPALVIGSEVVSTGRVLSLSALRDILARRTG